MIIDKFVKEMLHERQELFNQVSPFETVILENDDGLVQIEDEDSTDNMWYRELSTDEIQAAAAQQAAAQQAAAQQAVAQSPEAAAQMQAAAAQQAAAQQAAAQSPEAAAQMQAAAAQQAAAQSPEVAAQMQAGLDPDDLAAIQITQTQEVFTKMYLIKRLEKIKRYVNNLIDLMEMKFDIDEFDQLKRYSIYIETLDQIALILPAETLFHIIVDFEFELIELIEKINKIVNNSIQNEYKQEKDII